MQSLWAALIHRGGVLRKFGDGQSGRGTSDFSIVSGIGTDQSPTLPERTVSQNIEAMRADYARGVAQGATDFQRHERETARVRATQISQSIEVDVLIDIKYLIQEEQKQTERLKEERLHV
jgi:hypothetical protein